MKKSVTILFLFLAACTHDDTMTVDGAPLRSHSALSVFGVYRDGRMQPDAWNDVEQYLHLGDCPLGFDEALHDRDPLTYARINDDSRQNGISRELLKNNAARAEGEYLLVVQMTGKPVPPKPETHSADVEQNTGSAAQGAGGMAGGGMGGMRGANRGGHSNVPRPGTNYSESAEGFEVQASIYSPATNDYVARVGLQYTGSSTDEAMKKFAAKMHEILPSAKCVGWK